MAKEYELNYYPLFKCVAGECKHTCCAGWEICVDEQSLSAYKTNDSSFSDRFEKGINYKKATINRDKAGRCVFLDQNGLCDIISNLGEGALCQVCRDHPRFRAFFTDRTETGLGFCCEEATRIILSFPDKIQPVLVKDDEEEKTLEFVELKVLSFRETALLLVQDRTISIDQRINGLLTLCGASLNKRDLAKTVKTFCKFERIDKVWRRRLKRLKKRGLVASTEDGLGLYAEQFLVNSLYRHLCDADDVIEVRERTVGIVLCWLIVKNVYQTERQKKEDFPLLCDVVRNFSAEVEYSEANLAKLFDFASKLIRI